MGTGLQYAKPIYLKIFVLQVILRKKLKELLTLLVNMNPDVYECVSILKLHTH